MPASGSGESGRGAELLRCPGCGAPTAHGDRFCRTCGVEQAPVPEQSKETAQLTGARAGGADLEPPTEETTRTEPPTERRPPRRPGPPPPPRAERQPPVAPEPRQGNARRRLIAIATAALLGLLAGLVAVVALNGGDDRGRTASAEGEAAPRTAPDPVETLRAHFDRLEQGRFLAAADDLTPALLDSLGGKTIWVSERIADLLIDAQLDATGVEETDSTATVRVDSLRTDSLANGCIEFSGSYSMVRSGERWLISSADLVDRPC